MKNLITILKNPYTIGVVVVIGVIGYIVYIPSNNLEYSSPNELTEIEDQIRIEKETEIIRTRRNTIKVEVVYKYDYNDNLVEMSKYLPNGDLCSNKCSRDHGDYYHIIKKYDSNNNKIYFKGSDSCGTEEYFYKYDSRNNMIESIFTDGTRWGVKYTYEYDSLDSLVKVSKFHNHNIDTSDDWEEVIYE